jgi:hypothetical protein
MVAFLALAFLASPLTAKAQQAEKRSRIALVVSTIEHYPTRTGGPGLSPVTARTYSETQRNPHIHRGPEVVDDAGLEPATPGM